MNSRQAAYLNYLPSHAGLAVVERRQVNRFFCGSFYIRAAIAAAATTDDTAAATAFACKIAFDYQAPFLDKPV
jgi:hypothetical protein